MKIIDKVPVMGQLSLRVYKKIAGRKTLIETWTDENKVVTNGKQLICYLLAGEPGNNEITQFAVGEDPAVPDDADSALLNPFYKDLDGYSYLAPNIVQWTLSVDSGEANGLQITEFGLFSTGGTLFSRKIRLPAIPKDSDIIIEGDWTVWIFECKISHFASAPVITTATDSTIYQNV